MKYTYYIILSLLTIALGLGLGLGLGLKSNNGTNKKIYKGKGKIRNNEYIDKFYFIHNFKVMGTTIYSQLPKKYNKRFYGEKTLKEYEKINKIILKEDVFNKNINISIDHIQIDNLFNLGILKEEDKKRKYMMIVRDPISRFISICNFTHTSPDDLLYKIKKNNTEDHFYQYTFVENKNNINIVTYKMSSTELIKKYFAKFNIDINFDKKKNISSKKYSTKDISIEDVEFLKEYYKKDYELYNNSL